MRDPLSTRGRLDAIADRAAGLTCDGIPCTLSAEVIRGAGQVERWRAAEQLKRSLATLTEPRWAPLRALYAEAMEVVS